MKNIQKALRWIFISVAHLALFCLGLTVALFLCFTIVMKFGSVVNDTSMLQEARTTNIYDSIRRESRKEDMKLAKEIYEFRIENNYYNNNK